MKIAHQNIQIQEKDYNIFMEHFREAMKENNIDPALIAHIIKMIDPLRK